MTGFVRAQLHRNARLFGLARGILFGARRFFSPIVLPAFPGRVHPNDFMANRVLPGNAQKYTEYAEHSRLHFDIISAGLQRAGRSWSDLDSVIDFGCGYGRVTRWLPTVMPADKVTACDVQEEAVQWCAREFGVRPLIAAGNIVDTQFNTYDCLFAISVATHLSPDLLRVFLTLLGKIINIGGVVIFSAHGFVSARDAAGIKEYLDPNDVVSALEESGIAFIPYPHYAEKEIGDTFFTKQYLVDAMSSVSPNFALTSFEEASFWGCQDCYVFTREA